MTQFASFLATKNTVKNLRNAIIVKSHASDSPTAADDATTSANETRSATPKRNITTAATPAMTRTSTAVSIRRATAIDTITSRREDKGKSRRPRASLFYFLKTISLKAKKKISRCSSV